MKMEDKEMRALITIQQAIAKANRQVRLDLYSPKPMVASLMREFSDPTLSIFPNPTVQVAERWEP